jgi:ABC-type polysaccharide/polyol phosphate export permease
VLQLLRSLKANRGLLWSFVGRDLKARYVGSSLGFFWSVVYPIMNLAVYLLVFQIILKMTWDADKSSQEVVLLMLVAIVAWTAFAEAISRSTNILVDNQNLIQKVVFPVEVLPAYVTISAIVNMIIALPIVLLALLYAKLNPTDDPAVLAAAAASGHQGVQLGAQLLWVPALLVLQGVFTAGLGYFLATFNLFWRDTFHVIGVALTVWMFITPIFYPPQRMVDKDYGWMLDVNPMHWLMDMYRGVLVQNQGPDPELLLRFGVATVVVFALGSAFFTRQRSKFSDLL